MYQGIIFFIIIFTITYFTNFFIIWNIGMSFSLLAAEKAGAALSYGLGQGATLVAALWGVFIWKEFKGAPKGTNTLLTAMFIFFLAGLGLLIYSKM